MATSSRLISYDNLVLAISGAFGSMSAMAVTAPLDTIRTRLLLDKSKRQKSTLKVIMELVEDEGVLTFYRGIKSTLQCVAVSNFVYFYTFHGLKHIIGGPGKQSALKDLAFACIAGSFNVLVTNPLWVVNLRIKTQGTSDSCRKYNGLVDGLLKVGRDEGVEGLWSGLVPSLILVANPAIKFSVYEYLKRKALQWLQIEDDGVQQLGATQAFIIGVMASLMSTIVTYPVQVAQAKTRHGHGYDGLRKNASMSELIVYIARNYGIQGLFKGLKAKLVQAVVAAGFMFLTYEEMAKITFMIFGLHRSRKITKS